MERTVNWKAFGILAFVLVVIFGIWAQIRSDQEPKTASASNSYTIMFGTQQDDTQGYGGRKWGSNPTEDFRATDMPLEIPAMVQKIIGPPGSISGDIFLPDGESQPDIKLYVAGDDVRYGYHEGRLAFAVIPVHGDYDSTLRTMEEKFGRHSDFDYDNVAGSESSNNWEGREYSGSLFKRAGSNTIVVLFQSQSSSQMWLLYIPNFYYQKLRHDWWENFANRKKQEAAKEAADANAAQKKTNDALQ